MSQKISIAIIFGGRSAEHQISLVSTRNIIGGLDPEKYEIIPIAIDPQGRWFTASEARLLLEDDSNGMPLLKTQAGSAVQLPTDSSHRLKHMDGQDLPRIDVVFPVLHGPFGEDGSMQGLLRILDLPYVGPDVLGSAVGMDKDVMKRLLRDANIPIGDFLVYRLHELEEIQYKTVTDQLGSPLFIKPANMGSSIGISRVEKESEFLPALKDAFLYDSKIVIEANITGRELECAVLGNTNPRTSAIGEIIPRDGWYSYKAKYFDEKGAVLDIPARLAPDIIEQVQQVALQTYQILCLEGLSRVDMFLTKNNQIYVNEVNTMPGFTSISMYPKLWEESGLLFSNLLDELIRLALERHTRQSKLQLKAKL